MLWVKDLPIYPLDLPHHQTLPSHVTLFSYCDPLLVLIWVCLLNRPRGTYIHMNFPFITLSAELTLYIASSSFKSRFANVCIFLFNLESSFYRSISEWSVLSLNTLRKLSASFSVLKEKSNKSSFLIFFLFLFCRWQYFLCITFFPLKILHVVTQSFY